jgi:hypothetical protein
MKKIICHFYEYLIVVWHFDFHDIKLGWLCDKILEWGV